MQAGWAASPLTTRVTPTTLPDIKRMTAPATGAVVSFTASTSYATALRLVTGLGLQLESPCMQADTDKQGNIVAALNWVPIGGKDNFKTVTGTSTSGTVGAPPTVTVITTLPAIVIGTTALTPADWLARLRASSTVSSINTHALFSCPNMTLGVAGRSGKITSIAPKDAGTYVKVTFATTGMSYDDALYTVSSMGFRLAAPCYEQEAGKPADWHLMGQQQAFASTHTLTLATSNMSPTDWQTRIAHASGVTNVVAPYKATC